MTPRMSSTPQIDRLISESKQVTTDLMALRHAIARFAALRATDSVRMRMPADRAYLIIENLRTMSDELHKLWESMIHPPKEIERIADEEVPKAARRFREQRTLVVRDGKLQLGTGGR